MAMQYSCDYCGEPITDDLMVSLDARGQEYDPDGLWGRGDRTYSYVRGDIGHYHASEDRACWAEMLDRVSLIHDVSAELGLRPDELAERREQRAGREREERAARQTADVKWRERRERKRAWRTTPREARERLLLDALGDDQLMLSELAQRMTAKLGWREFSLYDGGIRTLAMDMLRAGQLERVPEAYRGKTRYRWHRKPGLEGPIVDLERTYHDDDEAVA